MSVNVRPAKLLPVKFTLGNLIARDTGGNDYEYEATLSMANPVYYSSTYGANRKKYTLEHINVGDYVSTTGNGRIMKIITIVSNTDTTATIRVVDEYLLNSAQDSGGILTPWIESQNGIIFEVRQGRPILFPYTEYSTSVIGFVKDYGTEIISRFNYLRQDSLFDIYVHPGTETFAIGDLITHKNGGWRLCGEDDLFIGTVVEINMPITGYSRIKPNGSLIDIELPGTGPYYWLDPNAAGKLVEVQPTAPDRITPAYFKLSSTQAIYFEGAVITRNSQDNFVTVDGNQTITGEKTFTARTTFNGAADFNGSAEFNNIDVSGTATIQNINVGSDAVISGNLTVSGTTTTIDTTNTRISDQLLELTDSGIGDSGIIISRTGSNNVFFGYDADENEFTIGDGTFTGESSGNLTISRIPVHFGDTEVDSIVITGNTTIGGSLDVVGPTTVAGLTAAGNVGVTGDLTVFGDFGIDNISIHDNVIESINANGEITLDPAGSGDVILGADTTILGNTSNTSVVHSMNILANTTTSATQLELFMTNGLRIDLAANTTMMFEADVIGREANGNNHCGFKLQGVIDNTGGTTVIVNAVNETIVAETNDTWAVVAEADDTNDTLVFKVTGAPATTIKWVAFVKTTAITH